MEEAPPKQTQDEMQQMREHFDELKRMNRE